MSINTDFAGLSTDGTMQRFTLSTGGRAAAEEQNVTEFDALLAANDPDSAHALGEPTGMRVHVRGEVAAVVSLREDLVTDVRRVVWLDEQFGKVA